MAAVSPAAPPPGSHSPKPGPRDAAGSVEAPPPPHRFQVGEAALCRWGPDQTWHVCELVQRREAPPSASSSSSGHSNSVSSSGSASATPSASSSSVPSSSSPSSSASSSSSAASNSSAPAKSSTDFYIHYHQLDRRNDQWVNESQLRPLTAAAELARAEPQSAATLALAQQLLVALAAAAPGGGAKTGKPGPGGAKTGLSVDALLASPTAGVAGTPAGGVRTRKRKFGDISAPSQLELSDPADAALEREHEERTKVKNIEVVSIGQFEVDCWYYSPYPEGYRNLHKIYVCEFCLRYMRKPQTLAKHRPQCQLRHPPGDEIYRDGNLAVFEVDGGAQPIYCQCLCLLGKLFIDHKTLYYDVEPFLFYVLTEFDENGHHVVGYFSKEKHSAEGYNLACILTFPQYQRRGFGRFLIALSYALSRLEGTTGSPEKPLSDLGRISYRSYWTRTVLEALEGLSLDTATVEDVARLTGIRIEDCISTLKYLGLIRYVRGDHVISTTAKAIRQHLERLPPLRPEHVTFRPEQLVWSKPVFAPGDLKHAGASSSASASHAAHSASASSSSSDAAGAHESKSAGSKSGSSSKSASKTRGGGKAGGKASAAKSGGAASKSKSASGGSSSSRRRSSSSSSGGSAAATPSSAASGASKGGRKSRR